MTFVDLRLAAAVAAAAVLGVSAGDGFVAVTALLVAAGPVVGLTAAVAMAATVARWGTADLGAVAGDQAVLGAAVGTGSVALALSSGLAAAALVLVARRRGDGWTGWVPVGALAVGAAALAAGPAPVGLRHGLVRAAGLLVAAGLAVAIAEVARRRPPLESTLSTVGVAAAGLAVVLATVA